MASRIILSWPLRRSPAHAMKPEAKWSILVLLLVAASLVVVALARLENFRQDVNRGICASHMRHVFDSMRVYAANNHGAYPTRLQDVASFFESGFPRCPAVDSGPPSASNAICDFEYVPPKADGSADQTSVLVYEPLGNHGEGMNVLYQDGSVQWIDRKAAQSILKGR